MSVSVNEDHPLEDVLETAIEEADGDAVSLQDLLKLYGDRAFGPIFTLLGLIAVIPPISGIPGLPSVIGVTLLLFAGQILMGRDHVWLPNVIAERGIAKERLETAHAKSEGFLETVDHFVTDRLEWATTGPARIFAAVLVVMLSLMMIPLEVVPFAVTLPGLAIVAIGLALLSRDGAIMLSAYALSAAGLAVMIKVSPLAKWLGLA